MCSIQTMAMPRDAQLADHADEFAGFPVREAAADLVEQQDGRVGGQGAGEFQPLAVEQPQRLGPAVGDAEHAAQLERVDGAVIGEVAREAAAVASPPRRRSRTPSCR